MQIVEPGDLSIHKIFWNPPRSPHQVTVNLPQQSRVLIEECLAEVRHLRHVPQHAQGGPRFRHLGDIVVFNQDFERLMIFGIAGAAEQRVGRRFVQRPQQPGGGAEIEIA